jgi:hypothetical protein
MLLFLVQCEPHVCGYFESLAAKLNVFVCNSMLVPALSEICLAPENRRHWNLLTKARDAGVALSINSATLDELVGHLRLAIEAYDKEYRNREDVYSDEMTLRYVDQIIIRAYLYEKAHGVAMTFDDFINKIVTPRRPAAQMRQEMIVFLREEFGIRFIEDGALGVEIEDSRLQSLTQELEKLKQTHRQAESDARTILTIYGLREKNNETGTAGIFGFKTWWLSKDTTTHRAVTACFHESKLVSCYLRPDFLLNYIALAGKSGTASKVFDQMFPTLIGVGLSHHVSPEVGAAVQYAIQKHKETSSSRVKAIIGGLSTKLMTEGGAGKGKQLRHMLDEAFKHGRKKRSPKRST